MPLTARKISLQFRSLKTLFEFVNDAKVKYCEINRSSYILSCDLSEADIILALRGYEAISLDE